MANEKAKEHFSAKKTEQKYANLLNNLLNMYGSIEEIIADFDEIKSMGIIASNEQADWDNFYNYLIANKKDVNDDYKNEFDEICRIYSQIENNLNIIEKIMPTENIISVSAFLDYIDKLTIEEVKTNTFKIDSISGSDDKLASRLAIQEDKFKTSYPEKYEELKQIRDKQLQRAKNISKRTLEESTKLYCDAYKSLCQSLVVKIQILNTRIINAKDTQERNNFLAQIQKNIECLQLAATYYVADLQSNIFCETEEVRNIVNDYVQFFMKNKQSLDETFYKMIQNNPQVQKEEPVEEQNIELTSEPTKKEEPNNPIIDSSEELNEPVVNPEIKQEQEEELESPEIQQTSVPEAAEALNATPPQEENSTSEENKAENEVETNDNNQSSPAINPELNNQEYQKGLANYMVLIEELNNINARINVILNEEKAFLLNSTEKYIEQIVALEKRAEPLFKLKNEIETRMNQLDYDMLMKTDLILGMSEQVKTAKKVTVEESEDFENLVELHYAILTECYSKIKEINEQLKQDPSNKATLEQELQKLVNTVDVENGVITRIVAAYSISNPSFKMAEFFKEQEAKRRKNAKKKATTTKEQEVDATKEETENYEKETRFGIRLGKLNFASEPQKINYQQNKISEANQFTISIIKQSIRIEYKKELVDKLRKLQAKIDVTVQRKGRTESLGNEVLSSNSEKIYQVIENPEDLEAAHILIRDENNEIVSDHDLMQYEQFKEKVDEIKSSMHR